MDKEQKLKSIIDDLLWMAARYAHGRHTYAPGMVRDAVEMMQILYPDWKPIPDKCIEPPKESEIKGFSFRDNYLDDIFNPITTI